MKGVIIIHLSILFGQQILMGKNKDNALPNRVNGRSNDAISKMNLKTCYFICFPWIVLHHNRPFENGITKAERHHRVEIIYCQVSEKINRNVCCQSKKCCNPMEKSNMKTSIMAPLTTVFC